MDTQYKRYEGISVTTATAAWGKWGSALEAHGIFLEDVVSQSQLHLLELLPKVDTSRTQYEQVNYICQSLRWALSSWIHRRLGDNEVPGDLPKPPPDEPTDKAGLMDLDTAMAQLDPETKRLLLLKYSGVPVSAIARQTGLSRKDVERVLAKGLGQLRRNML